MIQVGIIGGAGYTAGELLRILVHHPAVSISFVHSQSQADQPVVSIHTDLVGETDLHFTQPINREVDVLFFCGGHGKTAPFLAEHDIPGSVKLIDLSRDYRIQSPDHGFVYGLPELNREGIKAANHIANPGCFATCIQLALIPLADAQQLNGEIHITALTGSTGAGQKPTATTHFSWRNNNISVYKAFSHQHLGEIMQSVRILQPQGTEAVNFVPMRGDFTRGILASTYLDTPLSEEEALEIFQAFYASHPFTHVVDTNPHLKQVVNTNKGLIYVKKHGQKLHIISLIDNLLKGASGQAVQNMNLMCGLEEDLGLRLKAAAF